MSYGNDVNDDKTITMKAEMERLNDENELEGHRWLRKQIADRIKG